tara:strand:+ start:9482 stop:10396 length:915 start_codon:yes stop_codon:yes gene_type:complete
MGMHIFSKTVLAIGIITVLTQHVIAQDVTREELLNAPMLRTAQGHPDLTGVWIVGVPGAQSFASNGPGGSFYRIASSDNESVYQVRDGNFYWGEIDQEMFVKSDRGNMPLYKPEYWEEVRWNEEYGYERPVDPGFGCREAGIVKRGFPAEIIHLPNKVVLLYGSEFVSPLTAIRQIPTDGRPLRTEDEYEGLNQMGGSSVGHWDGDTLVVETVDFPADLLWYSTRGWPMSPGTKITERYTREGDVLRLDITVDDPAFIEPWEVRPEERRPDLNPGALFPPTPVCLELAGDSVAEAAGSFGARFR